MKLFTNNGFLVRTVLFLFVGLCGFSNGYSATTVIEGTSSASGYSSRTDYVVSKGPSWQSGSGVYPIGASRIGRRQYSRNVTEIDLGFYQYRKDSSTTATPYQDFVTGTVVTQVDRQSSTNVYKRPMEVYAPNGAVITNPGLFQAVQGVQGIQLLNPSIPVIPVNVTPTPPVAHQQVVVVPATPTVVVIQQPKSRLRMPYRQLIP